jgi:hypothetical protein
VPAADGKPGNASRIAFGGIAVALCLILLAAVFYLPTADLALLALTSLCIAAVVIEKGLSTAVVAWLSASALSFVFPGFQTAFSFVGFFGLYPLVKAWIEGRPSAKPWTSWLLKYLVFNALLAFGVALVLGPLAGAFDTAALLQRWTLRLYDGAPVLALMAIAAQFVFLVYDWALTTMISFYLRRIRPALSR